MKKMLVIAAVVAMAFAACGKKKGPDAPAAGSATEPAPADGSAAPPAGDGSAAPEAAPPAGG